jgi:hypothetical protein
MLDSLLAKMEKSNLRVARMGVGRLMEKLNVSIPLPNEIELSVWRFVACLRGHSQTGGEIEFILVILPPPESTSNDCQLVWMQESPTININLGSTYP